MNVTARHAVKRNRDNGFHYFDRETMDFFGSQVHKGYNCADGATLIVMSNRAGSGAFLELCAEVGTLCGVEPGDTEALELPAGGARYFYVIRVALDGRTTNVSHPRGWADNDHGWPDHTTADNFARALATL
jgi:hypothetical protein